jgi:hypothetical protein
MANTVTVQVNVNNNALAGLSSARASLLAIGPAAIAASAGVAALAAGIAAAASGIGVFAAAAIPQFGQISEALAAEKAATDAVNASTAQATTTNYSLISAKRALADAIEQGNRRIADATRAVEDAEENLARTVRDGARRIADAKKQVIEANENVVSAQRRLDDANRNAEKAQQKLNDARREAVQDLEDLQDKVTGASLAEERAAIRVRQAQEELQEVIADPSATKLQRDAAEMALKEALFGAEQQKEATQEVKDEAAAAAAAGVEGSQKVIDAKEGVADAEQAAADAAGRLTDAQEAVAEANQRVADTQLENAEAVADAQEAVADAHRNVAEAQQDSARAIADAQLGIQQAMESSSGAVDTAAAAQAAYQQKLADMPPATREAFEALQSLKGAFREWSDSLADNTMPVFTEGMKGLEALLPKLTPLVEGVADQLLRVTSAFRQKIETGQYDAVIEKLTKFSVKSLEKMVDFLGLMAEKFAEFVVSEQFDKLMAYGEEMLPKVVGLIGELADFVAKFVEAAGPMGGLTLDILGDMAEMLNAIPMDVMKQLAPIIIGIAMAIWFLSMTPLMMIITGILLLATIIYQNRDAIKEAWEDITDAIGDAWEWIYENVIEPIKDFFTKKIPGWARQLKDGVVGRWNDLVEKTREKVDEIREKWDKFVGFIRGIPSSIRNGLSGMWSSVTEGLKGALNSAISLINNGIFFINDKLIANANRVPGVNIPWIPYIPYLARGGIAGGLAVVGENGPELVNLPHGSMVRSNPDTRSILAGAGSGGGDRPIHITLQLGGKNIGDLLVDPLRGAVRARGGNVQAVLGRGV